jgi:hypothetical protein
MLAVAGGKYRIKLAVKEDQKMFCPKTNIRKKFKDLTAEDCEKMIAAGNKDFELVTKETPATK